jgi:hypothetical protein
MLLAVIVMGAALGVLGRMFLRNPVLALSVFALISTAVPFLLAIGTIIWLGLRGKPAWSARCGQCHCDLHWMSPHDAAYCPNCGADLTGPRAMRRARVPGRRWGLVVWAGVLLVTPIASTAILAVAQRRIGPSPGGLSVLSTQQLIQRQLPTQVNQPWVWNELERRLQVGSLAPQDVDAAIKKLTSHMTTTRPNGWDQPLSWQGDFVKAAVRAGKISEPVYLALCDAFYGSQPVIQPLPRVREGEPGFAVEVAYGNTWGHHSGLGAELVWEVRRVLLDRQPLDVRQNCKLGQRWSAYHDGSLKAGDHELTVEVECAYIDQDQLIGLNAADLPANRWPKARKRWKQSVSAPMKVYSASERIVPLNTDSRRDPNRSGGMKIERLVAQADQAGAKKIILRVAYTPELTIPLSCDVAVVLPGQTVQLGGQWVVQERNYQASGGSQLEARIDTLDASVKDAEIILTPNPKHIEHRPEVSEIWGGKIILQHVPIERLDLEAGQEGKEP